MTQVPIGLADVEQGCAKPGCGFRAALNRHHKAHEALWFGAWAHRGNEPKWKEFVDRYHEFREEDIVRICLPHHAEIHSLYDGIIAADCASTGLPLYLYSWKQARVLMEKLRNACDQWLRAETRGLDPDLYERTKRARRRRLKRNAIGPEAPNRAQRAEKLRRKKKGRRPRSG